MDDVTRITVRLPADIAAVLKAAATRGDRSLHAQIIRVLRGFAEAEQTCDDIEARVEAIKRRPGPKPGQTGGAE